MLNINQNPFSLSFLGIILILNSQAICVARGPMDLSPKAAPESAKTMSTPQLQAQISSEAIQFSDSSGPPLSSPSESPIADQYAQTFPFFSGFPSDKLRGNLRSNPLAMPQQLKSDPQSTTNPDLKSICDSTDYPALCLSSVSPLVSDKLDLISVLEAAIKACYQQIEEVISATKPSAKSAGVGSAHAICQDQYRDALDNLRSALDAIPSHDIGTIDTMLSAVMADLTTCDDGFEEMKAPLAYNDNFISNMASNCLAIAAMIKF